MEEKKTYSGKEIDVIDLAVTVLKGWKRLMVFGFAGAVIGVVIALCTPKTYTATVVLAPEISAGGVGMGGSLADMAASFGLDLGKTSSMDAIYPEIYPDIFSSSDFTHKLFDVEVRLVDNNTPVAYLTHIKRDTKKPFWKYPMIWLNKLMTKPEVVATGGKKGFVDDYRISRYDAKMCEMLSENITCVIDKKTSEITISFTDQDPMVAAVMVDTLQKRLQSYILDYRTHKARIDFDYYTRMCDNAQKEFERTQRAYGAFADSHKDALLRTISAKQNTLEQEMNNAYESYVVMMKMREQAQAKIQECTPAFTILQSSKLPHKPSSRPRLLTVMLFTVLGCMVDALYVLIQKNKKTIGE